MLGVGRGGQSENRLLLPSHDLSILSLLITHQPQVANIQSNRSHEGIETTVEWRTIGIQKYPPDSPPEVTYSKRKFLGPGLLEHVTYSSSVDYSRVIRETVNWLSIVLLYASLGSAQYFCQEDNSLRTHNNGSHHHRNWCKDFVHRWSGRNV